MSVFAGGKGLTTRFPVTGGLLAPYVANVHAAEDISFTINKGQTLSWLARAAAASLLRGAHFCGSLSLQSGEDARSMAKRLWR